jgi:hypothetical protein
MVPVESNTASLWPLLLIPVVLVTLFGVAVILLLKGMQSSYNQKTSPQSVPVQSVAAREPDPTPKPHPTPASAIIPVSPLHPPTTPPAPVTTTATPNASQTDPSPEPDSTPTTESTPAKASLNQTAEPSIPEFPALKLQAIFYRESNPSVMINSETLFQGDVIDQVQITRITRTGVTLKWKNQTKELSLR